MCIVFFFKQKTAYEMRISDWSSDVCSSDLQMCAGRDQLPADQQRRPDDPMAHHLTGDIGVLFSAAEQFVARLLPRRQLSTHNVKHPLPIEHGQEALGLANLLAQCARPSIRLARFRRSEEHTSELQSLMRISYAVFCLKKKNNNT